MVARKKILLTLIAFLFFGLSAHFVFAAAPDPAPGTAAGGGSNCTSTTELCNPTGATDVQSLINKVAAFLIQIAVPLAAIIIIWAGIQFLTANGSAEKISKARSALTWALVGLAIIFIGKGFVALIQDILTVKK